MKRPKKLHVDVTTRPPSTNGFAASYLCRTTSPNCVNGSCWHMGVMRMMIRRWFDVLTPVPHVKDPPDPDRPKPTRTQTAKEMEAARTDAINTYIERYGRPPIEYIDHKWGEGGVGCRPRLDGEYNDIDGVGDWGRHVRLMEDAQCERPG